MRRTRHGALRLGALRPEALRSGALLAAVLAVLLGAGEAGAQFLPPWAQSPDPVPQQQQQGQGQRGDTPPPQGTSRGENFSAGKTPAQLFGSDCTGAGCHRGPQGLSKGRAAGSLAGFLREHYTNSRESASALAGYLAGIGGEARPDPRDRRQPASRSAARPDEAARQDQPAATTEKPDDVRTRKPATETAKPEPKGRQRTAQPTAAPAAPAAPAAAPEPAAPPPPPKKEFDIFD